MRLLFMTKFNAREIHELIEFTCHSNSVFVSSAVFNTIHEFRQTNSFAPESGGMLFAWIKNGVVTIVEATKPSPMDLRSRFFFRPKLSIQQNTINEKFNNGLHFVGEWHTHPEKYPTPSNTDLKSMTDCFNRSKHELNGLIMIIMGTGERNDAIWVSIHKKDSFSRMIAKEGA